MRRLTREKVTKTAKNTKLYRNIAIKTRPGHKTQGILQVGVLRLCCALGRNGVSAFKREGDGATPLAVMRILSGFYRHPPLASLSRGIAWHRLRHDDGWCDAPDDANYNRLVRLPYRANSEVMQRDDALYNIGFVLDWNISSRRKKRGSAIFLHLTQKNLTPTQGCIAFKRRDMLRLLPYLRRNKKIIVLR